MQQCIKIFIILYLYEAQHVSGDTPPITRNLKLHWQPLGFHTWKVVERVAGGQRPPATRCNSYKMQQCIKMFIIPYLYEAQHVSGDASPIIRSPKLHWQPLVFHTWKVLGRVAGGRCQALPVSAGRCQALPVSGGRCQALPANVHQLHVQQPSTYEKPEAASAVLGP